MVVIASHHAARAVADPAGLLTEAVPDRFAAAIERSGPFDLVGGRRASPAEGRRELAARETRGGTCDRHDPSIGFGPDTLPQSWKAFHTARAGGGCSAPSPSAVGEGLAAR